MLAIISPVVKALVEQNYLSKTDFHKLLKDFVQLEEDVTEESIRQRCHCILQTIWPGAKACDWKYFAQHAWAAADQQRAMLGEAGKITLHLADAPERELMLHEIRSLKEFTHFFRAIAGRESKWLNNGSIHVPCAATLACFNRLLALSQGTMAEKLIWSDWLELFQFAAFVQLNDFSSLFFLLEAKIGPTPQDLADFFSNQEAIADVVESDATLRDLWIQTRDQLISEYFNCLGSKPKNHFDAIHVFEKACRPEKEWMKMHSYTARRHFNQQYIEGLKGLTALRKLTRAIENMNFWPRLDFMGGLKQLREICVEGSDLRQHEQLYPTDARKLGRLGPR